MAGSDQLVMEAGGLGKRLGVGAALMGAYTYDWIERRLGIDIHNSDRIIPEFQHLKVGDEIPMPGYAMRACFG